MKIDKEFVFLYELFERNYEISDKVKEKYFS